jgi:hypothetical protein
MDGFTRKVTVLPARFRVKNGKNAVPDQTIDKKAIFPDNNPELSKRWFYYTA